MRKLLALLLCLLLPFCAAGEDMAEEYIVALEGAEIFFSPYGGVCMTRETSASVFNRIGLSQREIIPFMEENDLYALLVDDGMTCEVQLTAYPTSEADYDDMTAFGAETTAAAFRNAYMDMGCDVQEAIIYHPPGGHLFIRTAFSGVYEGEADFVTEYMTCQAGYAVVISLMTYDTAPTEDQIAFANDLADSLYIRRVP